MPEQPQPALTLADMLVEVPLTPEQRRARERIREAAWQALVDAGLVDPAPETGT